MNVPDLVNGSFEFLAGFMVLNHRKAVIRDKAVAGVSILSTAFFSLWGMWNLWYYPHLGQKASFYGGLMIVVANCLWVGLMLKYRRVV